jgi:NhaP-type Na+/H+ or K+/H+ antiporter
MRSSFPRGRGQQAPYAIPGTFLFKSDSRIHTKRCRLAGDYHGAGPALALALPADAPARDLLVAMAFGVVLFTLLVQGLTLPLLIRRLGLAQPV